MKKQKISKELKEILLWKLDTKILPNYKLSVGDKGSFTRDELKEHIKKEDEIGIMFANMELSFMKALVNGEVTKILAE